MMMLLDRGDGGLGSLGLEQRPDGLERFEGPVLRHQLAGAQERLLDRLVRCGLDQRLVQLLERSHDLVGLLGVDQQRLHDEIKLAHGRRRLGQLQDMALQEKPRLVQQAQGDLLADRQHGAVDEDALAGLEGESHFGFHFRPS
jgi:hypothetical protein